MMILNLTQHAATLDQVAAGVVDPDPTTKAGICGLLTFLVAPDQEELEGRANALAELAARAGAWTAMIGGAGYLMPPLERALDARGIEPVHAFSRRESVETVGADGSVTKTQVFRHAGWVRPCAGSLSQFDPRRPVGE
jgi:hypothetical protein